MKIKNQDILNFASVKFAEKHLPVKLAFAIATNAEAMNGAVKAFESKRIELLKHYAEKDGTGNPVIEDDSYKLKDVVGFVKEFEELKETEAEIAVTTVSTEILEKCDEEGFDKLTVREMSILKFMIA